MGENRKNLPLPGIEPWFHRHQPLAQSLNWPSPYSQIISRFLNHHVAFLILNANVCPRFKAREILTIFSPGHVCIVPLFWKGCGIRSALNMDLPLRVDWVVFITRTKHLYDPLLLNNARIVVRESWWPLNLWLWINCVEDDLLIRGWSLFP